VLDEVVLIKEQYYIPTTSALADKQSQVLKYGETFAVLDRFGDIQPMGLGEQGIFHQGTRFLSRLLLRLGTGRPHLLSSKIREDNSLFTADLCNVDMQLSGHALLPRGSVHVTRSKFLWRATCYERFTFSNCSASDVELQLSLEIEADFCRYL